MVIKKGDIPINARCDVDYSNGSPKVKFSYPKRNARKEIYNQHVFGTHTLIITLILSITYFYIFIMAPYPQPYPQECEVLLDEGYTNVTISIEGFEDGKEVDTRINNYKTFVKGANFMCDTGNYSVRWMSSLTFQELNKKGFRWDGDFDLKYNYFQLGFIFLLIILGWSVNRLVTLLLIRSKKYRENFPKKQAGGPNKRKKYYRYGPKDLLGNVIVIPRFKNVELTYNTKGQFSEYLEKIQTREQRYYNYRKQKKGKLRIKNGEWFAVFHFKKKPTNGYLEVFYQ